MGHAEPILLLCVLAPMAGTLLLRNGGGTTGPAGGTPQERQRPRALPSGEAPAQRAMLGQAPLAPSIHQTSPGAVQDQLVDEPAPVPSPAGWADVPLNHADGLAVLHRRVGLRPAPRPVRLLRS